MPLTLLGGVSRGGGGVPLTLLAGASLGGGGVPPAFDGGVSRGGGCVPLTLPAGASRGGGVPPPGGVSRGGGGVPPPGLGGGGVPPPSLGGGGVPPPELPPKIFWNPMSIMVKTALIRINTQEKTNTIIPHRRASIPGPELPSSGETFSICANAALTETVPSSAVST